MQYDLFNLGFANSNGIPVQTTTRPVLSYNIVYFMSFTPIVNDYMFQISTFAEKTGSPTLANHKLYITEAMAGKTYHVVAISVTNNTLTLSSNHGLQVNDKIVVFGATMPDELTRGGVYWVVDVSLNDIKISATQGGDEIDLTTIGSNVCVAKYIDHSVLSQESFSSSNTYRLYFNNFTQVILDNTKTYFLMLLNLEPSPSTHYYSYYTIDYLETPDVVEYTTNLTSIQRVWNRYKLQFMLRYNNNVYQRWDIGSIQVIGYQSNITNNNYKYGNYYKNNTNTKLYISAVRVNTRFAYNTGLAKDTTFVCQIIDRATKSILATSIGKKPFTSVMPSTNYQPIYFRFANPYEWALNSEVYIVVAYSSGYSTSSTTYLGIQQFYTNNPDFGNFYKLLDFNREPDDYLLLKKAVSYDGTSWIETSNFTMHDLSLYLDTANPTGNVAGGGLTEFVSFG